MGEITDSCWAILSVQTSDHIAEYLYQYLDQNDRLMVIKSGQDATWYNAMAKTEFGEIMKTLSLVFISCLMKNILISGEIRLSYQTQMSFWISIEFQKAPYYPYAKVKSFSDHLHELVKEPTILHDMRKLKDLLSFYESVSPHFSIESTDTQIANSSVDENAEDSIEEQEK